MNFYKNTSYNAGDYFMQYINLIRHGKLKIATRMNLIHTCIIYYIYLMTIHIAQIRYR